MENLRNKIHSLVEQFSEEELEAIWETIYRLHCNFEMKKAIQAVKNSRQPWDVLNHDEAIQYLEEL